MNSWQSLDDELDAWRACDRQATLWWRDDDACRESAALTRMLEIAQAAEVPLALATIPALLEPSLLAAVGATEVATIVQHGYAHRNHAPPGARNWELGADRPVGLTVTELAQGRAALEKSFASRFVPVLVPPWNRIDAEVIAQLPSAGFLGLSTFGPRAAPFPIPGLAQCNAHIDLIAWRRDRAFIGVASAIDRIVEHLRMRREGSVDPLEPTGMLTHHLDLGDAAWQFMADLLPRTRAHGALWLDVDAVFGGGWGTLGAARLPSEREQ